MINYQVGYFASDYWKNYQTLEKQKKCVGKWKCNKNGKKVVYLAFLAKIFEFYQSHLVLAKLIVLLLK